MIVSITMMMISKAVPAINRIPAHLLGSGFGIIVLVKISVNYLENNNPLSYFNI